MRYAMLQPYNFPHLSPATTPFALHNPNYEWKRFSKAKQPTSLLVFRNDSEFHMVQHLGSVINSPTGRQLLRPYLVMGDVLGIVNHP